MLPASHHLLQTPPYGKMSSACPPSFHPTPSIARPFPHPRPLVQQASRSLFSHPLPKQIPQPPSPPNLDLPTGSRDWEGGITGVSWRGGGGGGRGAKTPPSAPLFPSPAAAPPSLSAYPSHRKRAQPRGTYLLRGRGEGRRRRRQLQRMEARRQWRRRRDAGLVLSGGGGGRDAGGGDGGGWS